jgi:hypothetical protein
MGLPGQAVPQGGQQLRANNDRWPTRPPAHRLRRGRGPGHAHRRIQLPGAQVDLPVREHR